MFLQKELNEIKEKRLSMMPRTKGSKNRPKCTADFASQIAEKHESITSLTTEIASITANIDTLKAAEEAKKAEAEEVLKKLLASGVSADEILEKLK